MDPVAAAVFASWRIEPGLLLVLVAAVALYIRGWHKLRRELPDRYTNERLTAFLSGVALVFLALASPLDAFAGMLLQVHMVQHLILIMAAPVLIWLGQPIIPLMRGLPGAVFTNALGPFLGWQALRRAGRAITHPVVCWLALALAVVFWHQPRWYELGLTSPDWHKVEHLCFLFAALLFWWPVVGVWPGKPQWSRWMMIPYLVFADMVNTGVSAWLVFSHHVVYPTYAAAPRLWGISAMDDQATAGALMWVPGSIAYLIPAFLLTMQALKSGERSTAVRAARPAVFVRHEVWDLLRVPLIGPIMRHRHFRRVPQAALFALALAVMVDGMAARSQPAPLNLAGVLPWTYWRGFTIVALLAGGNFFCMACPFMLTRDLGRKWLPASYRWPVRLRSKWLAAGLIAVYLWAYEAFSLWASPWWTAWIIAGYFVTSFAIDGIFEGASFCKYVCPVGQFHFVNSLVSPLEVKVRSAAVCDSCSTHDCIKGNAQQRGCELHLFQPQKRGNMDCTFCLDCVQACPTGNVGILRVAPAAEIGTKQRLDVAVLAMVLVFGALVNAAGMAGPVMMKLHSVHGALTAFYAVGLIVPAALVALAGKRTASSAMALVPLGASMWAAHLGWHLVTGWTSLGPVVARILNKAVTVSPGQTPDWLTGAQILLMDTGLLITLAVVWRVSGKRLAAAAPWVVIAVSYFAVAVWVVLQPMQMRGMVMNP